MTVFLFAWCILLFNKMFEKFTFRLMHLLTNLKMPQKSSERRKRREKEKAEMHQARELRELKGPMLLQEEKVPRGSKEPRELKEQLGLRVLLVCQNLGDGFF